MNTVLALSILNGAQSIQHNEEPSVYIPNTGIAGQSMPCQIPTYNVDLEHNVDQDCMSRQKLRLQYIMEQIQ